MKFWLVSEGSSDVPLITQALKNCEAALGKTIELLPQAPVTDATTGNAERFGYPEVLDWCRTNGSGRQLMATKYRYMMGGATALIVHLDADIAENLSVNGQQFQAEGDRVTWVRAALLEALGALAAELKIILAVPKMQIETWILATYTLAELNQKQITIASFEDFVSVEPALISLGYKRDDHNAQKLFKSKALYQGNDKYAKRLGLFESRVSASCPQYAAFIQEIQAC